MDNFKAHAIEQGSEILQEMVKEVTKHKDHFHIITSNKKEFKTKKVILAT